MTVMSQTPPWLLNVEGCGLSYLSMVKAKRFPRNLLNFSHLGRNRSPVAVQHATSDSGGVEETILLDLS